VPSLTNSRCWQERAVQAATGSTGSTGDAQGRGRGHRASARAVGRACSQASMQQPHPPGPNWPRVTPGDFPGHFPMPGGRFEDQFGSIQANFGPNSSPAGSNSSPTGFNSSPAGSKSSPAGFPGPWPVSCFRVSCPPPPRERSYATLRFNYPARGIPDPSLTTPAGVRRPDAHTFVHKFPVSNPSFLLRVA
jgi:hypothetical protein